MNEAEQQAIAAAVARQLEEFCSALEARVRQLATQCSEIKGNVDDQASATTRLAKKLQDVERSKDAPTLTFKGGETISLRDLVTVVTTAVMDGVLKEIARTGGPADAGGGKQMDVADLHRIVAAHDQTMRSILSMQTDLGRQLIAQKSFFATKIRMVAEFLVTFEKRMKGVRWKGVWQPGTQALAGEFWTEGGSVWHCNEATTDRPGNGSNAWTLSVKRGRDGSGHR